MSSSLQDIVTLLLAYKYLVLFPLSIFEGPIVTVIAGFISSLNKMNWVIVYCVVILGDIVGDSSIYIFGRWGGNIFKKHGFRVGVTHKRLDMAKEYFAIHHSKALIASKLVHGIGVSGLAAAGILKIPYIRFFKTCLIISLLQSASFLMIGILFGHAYQQIGHYFDTYAALISLAALVIIFFIAFLKIKKVGIQLK